MKTRFSIELGLRIALEGGHDRFTDVEIMSMLGNRKAEIVNGDSCHFVCRKSDGKIMAQIETIKQLNKPNHESKIPQNQESAFGKSHPQDLTGADTNKDGQGIEYTE